MQKFTVERCIMGALATIIALFLLIGQTFALVSVGGVGESGLQLLDFSAAFLPAEGYAWVGYLFGTLNLIHLLAGLALIAVNLVALVFFEEKLFKLIHTLTVGISVLFAFYYMAEGIAYASLCSALAGKTYMTYAFFAEALVVVGAAGYLAMNALLKRELPKLREAAEESAAMAEEEEETEGTEAPLSDTVPLDKLDAYLFSIRGYVRPNRMETLKKTLAKLSPERFYAVSLTKLKNPSLVLLFSVFLGVAGVDRFYIGDTKYAVLKLLFGWLTLWVWQLFDIFYCFRDAKELNFRLLMESAAA